MAIHHASSGELIDIRPFEENLKSATTKTLYKSNHLEVFRMVLLAGKAMPAHHVVGEITVQCLEGSVEFAVAGTSQLMREGDLICLAGATLIWRNTLTLLRPTKWCTRCWANRDLHGGRSSCPVIDYTIGLDQNISGDLQSHGEAADHAQGQRAAPCHHLGDPRPAADERL